MTETLRDQGNQVTEDPGQSEPDQSGQKTSLGKLVPRTLSGVPRSPVHPALLVMEELPLTSLTGGSKTQEQPSFFKSYPQENIYPDAF